ncbi:MAG: transglutaminase-like domain-containing protein [Burkholderiales bacterium]|nr:transglutaminase-like domain-containing protein [Burkholderiales bacterium]
MIASRILRRTSALVLITFTSLTMQPLQAAMQLPKAERAKPAAATPDEKFSRALADIHEILKQLAPAAAMPAALTGKQKDIRAIGPDIKIIVEEDIKPMPGVNVAAKMKELRSKLKDIGDYSKAAEDSFAEVEKHIKDKKLPAEILARHEASVKEYQARKIEFETLTKAVSAADDAADKKTLPGALNALGAFFAKYPNEKAHTPTDPNKLPWRTPDGKVRKPFETEKEFKTSLFKQERTHLAGPIPWGLTLPATNLPATPVAGDLASTEDVQITPAIQTLADSLGKSPVKIHNWVRNNIEFLPTYGSIQGADMTLQTKRGNAFDTASLLIGLLRASGIPARYVYGTIEVPADKAMNWVGGVTKPEAAQSLLGQGGIPNIGVIAGGTMRSIKLEHVWVEAWVDYVPSRGAVNKVGDTWVKMDASFKQYTYTQGIDIKTAVPLDANALITQAQTGATVNQSEGWVQNLNQAAVTQTYKNYATQLQAYLDSRDPEAVVGDIMGTKQIQQQNYSILLGSLPYKTLAIGTKLSALPTSVRHTTTIALYLSELDRALDAPGLSYTISLPALGYKRLGVTYVPATPADQQIIDSYKQNNAAVLPAYLINVQPAIQIDGQTVATGPSLKMGAAQFWSVTLSDPLGQLTGTENFGGTSGDEMVFGINGNGVTNNLVIARMIGVNPDTAAENLHQLGLHYWMEHDLFDEMAAKALGVTRYRLPSVGQFSSPLTVRYFFGVPKSGFYGGRQIDAKRVAYAVAAPDTKSRIAFAMQAGAQGSLIEGTVVDQLFSRPDETSVSTSQILSIANRQGLKLFLVKSDNLEAQLALISTTSEVKQDIRNAVAVGMHAVIPEREITHNGWSGTGYILQDPITGAAAYLIDGGLNGDFSPACQPGLVPIQSRAATAALNGVRQAIIRGAAATGVRAGVAAASAIAVGTTTAAGAAIATISLALTAALVVSVVVMVLFWLYSTIMKLELAEAQMIGAAGSTDCSCAPEPKPAECGCKITQPGYHRGGDPIHNRCADILAYNDFPGSDTCVTTPAGESKCFDTYKPGQVCEVKTYNCRPDRSNNWCQSSFLQDMDREKALLEARIAQECKLSFCFIGGDPQVMGIVSSWGLGATIVDSSGQCIQP